MKNRVKKNDYLKWLFVIASIALVACALFKAKNGDITNTIWSLVPACVAILLALVTKEVYISLFAGIVTGAFMLTGIDINQTVDIVFKECILGNICNPDKMSLLIWPVFLGSIVFILEKSNASSAFGAWTKKHVKTAIGAQFCAVILGILIFIDDYFNCMTVGSVMRPITDEHQISREKLAYIIDSTAAPICIIAPISSWAAAVAGFVPDKDGFSLFVQTIPYNFYALLTIIFLFVLVGLNVDYGPMKKCKKSKPVENEEIHITDKDTGKSKAFDLLIPIVCTVIFCVLGMLYTGDYFAGNGISIQYALANCNASFGLLLGSFFGMAFTMIYFICRKILKLEECMNALPEGLKLMSSAIIVLILAWALNSITSGMGAAAYVSGIVRSLSSEFLALLPAIVFLIAIFLSFATGTSWGTFGILIPIVVYALSFDQQLMLIGISACLAGSVCGDHCSPISDTTIMASAGSQCRHIDHVTTQFPYAFTVALISFISFIIAGFCRNWVVPLIIGIGIVCGVLLIVRYKKGVNQDDISVS